MPHAIYDFALTPKYAEAVRSLAAMAETEGSRYHATTSDREGEHHLTRPSERPDMAHYFDDPRILVFRHGFMWESGPGPQDPGWRYILAERGPA